MASPSPGSPNQKKNKKMWWIIALVLVFLFLMFMGFMFFKTSAAKNNKGLPLNNFNRR